MVRQEVGVCTVEGSTEVRGTEGSFVLSWRSVCVRDRGGLEPECLSCGIIMKGPPLLSRDFVVCQDVIDVLGPHLAAGTLGRQVLQPVGTESVVDGDEVGPLDSVTGKIL